jgi:hypothetical protein
MDFVCWEFWFYRAGTKEGCNLMNTSANKMSFIKRNYSLLIGILLPVLLVIVFWIAMIIPQMLVDPPHYDLILFSRFHPHGPVIEGTVNFDVKNGRLRATYRANLKRNSYGGMPNLYYFNVSTGSLRPISMNVPDALEDGAVIPVPELEQYTLSSERLSADGYRFDNTYRGSRGFLFFYGYRYYAKLEKKGRILKIPGPENYNGNLEFLAWVQAGDE